MPNCKHAKGDKHVRLAAAARLGSHRCTSFRPIIDNFQAAVQAIQLAGRQRRGGSNACCASEHVPVALACMSREGSVAFGTNSAPPLSPFHVSDKKRGGLPAITNVPRVSGCRSIHSCCSVGSYACAGRSSTTSWNSDIPKPTDSILEPTGALRCSWAGPIGSVMGVLVAGWSSSSRAMSFCKAAQAVGMQPRQQSQHCTLSRDGTTAIKEVRTPPASSQIAAHPLSAVNIVSLAF
jgi:hypothetical protein